MFVFIFISASYQLTKVFLIVLVNDNWYSDTFGILFSTNYDLGH